MTTEELLNPRYKVIGEYPCSTHRLGDIIITNETGMSYVAQIGDVSADVCLFDYPRLFERLSWWEEREKSEMPIYVKNIFGKLVYKVVRWFDDGMFYYFDDKKKDNIPVFVYNFMPATEEEYLQFANQK